MRNCWIVLFVQIGLLAATPGREAVPVFFVANQGQAPAEVRFMAKSPGITAWFLNDGVVFRSAGGTVRLRFDAAETAGGLEGQQPLPGSVNFLKGDVDSWRVGVPLFGKIVYRNLYPGIDMVFSGNSRDLKSEFRVAAGADPSRISVRYVGTERARIDDDGSLRIPVVGEPFREQAPLVYQEREGKRVAVESHFRPGANGAFGFELGRYDHSLPLVIDPVLSYSTLLGGSGSDSATGIAVDSSGSAYVAGFTASYDFPTLSPSQNYNAGGNDVFVAKLNAAGNGLIYCTYIGGSADDRAYGIAVDSGGSAYVTGSTTSSNFPTRYPLQSRLLGSRNAFVVKLNAAGNAMLYSTYLGGSGGDYGYGIAVDGTGNAYVTGDTTSVNFPATGFQKGFRGVQDAFVAKVSSDGSHLVYSTYLGGSNTDHAAAIAVDTGGTAYVTGSTYSTDFPTLNPFQAHLAGGGDAFIARLNSTGAALLFSTYLGGSNGVVSYPETGQGIAVDAQGNGYVVGVTSSADFPTLHAAQTSLGGWLDAFVTKVNSAGALMYSTYVGGSGVEVGYGVAVDLSGSAYVTGYTYSTDLPVTGPPVQAALGGDCDAFLAKLSPAGDSFAYLSYLGGSGSDTGAAVALDPAGAAYVAGWTLSTNFPEQNPYQTINAGNYGAFVTKLSFAQLPGIGGVSPSSGSGASQTFAFQYTDSAGAADLVSVAADFNTAASTVNGCVVNFNRASNTLWLFTDAGVQPASGITPGSGSQQNSQCTLSGSGSSVSVSGNTLTLNLALTFAPAFAGTKTIYMQAVNPNGTTTWQSEGSWSVAAQVLTASVTPTSGSGSSQTFALVYTDTAGASDLTSVSVLINSSLSTTAACSVVYTRASNSLALLTDSGAMPGSTIAPGSGSQVNSQCTLNGVGSSITTSGSTLTLNLSLTFQNAFGGNKSVYMQAVSPFATAVWQAEGSWTVPTQVQLVSATPSSGSGNSQTFTLQYSDSAGATDLTSVSVLVNSSLATVAACSVTYTRASNTLALSTDSGGSSGTITPGSGSQSNSQCTLNGAGSSVSTSGVTLTLNLAITFLPAFGGVRNIYLQAVAPSGTVVWQQKGTWTVPATVQAVSVSPASGSGNTQTFTLQFSDSAGATDLTSVSALISSTATAVGSCEVEYYRASNTLQLLTDSGVQPSGSLTPGSGSQSNSQCMLTGAGSSVVVSGNTLTLSLALTFQTTYGGVKKVYMEAVNALGTSGWQQKGTWTVPVTVQAVSVAPASGSGYTQTFSLQFTDSGGATDLNSVSTVVSASLTGVSSCEVDYYPASNTLRLLNDSGGQPSTILTVGSGTVSNSQCTLNGAGTSVNISGTTLTLNLALTFQTAYGGVKKVYLEAVSTAANSGWQQKGAWTVPATVQAVSVAPASGSGSGQTFTLQVSDSAGAADLNSVSTVVSGSLTSVSSCEVDYYRASNTLRLLTDSGGQPAGSLTPGSGSQSNSQCILSGASSSATVSGTTITLNLALSFQSGYGGAKNVYLEALGASGTAAWQQKGTWTVPAPVQVISVTPSSGSGASSTLSLQFSDSSGATDLTIASVLINSSLTAANGCEVDYYRASNTLKLLTDSGGQPSSSLTPGSGTVSNSQCTLNGAGSSVTTSGNVLTVKLAFTFQPVFGGVKNVYLDAASPTASAPWLQKGTWTAPATVQSVSVSPNTGTGSRQTFSFQFTDSAGGSDLTSVSMLFNTSLSGVGGCEVDYFRPNNSLQLLTDSGGQPFITISPGSGSQQNSQCLLNGAGSSVSISGTTLTFTLSVTFFAPFAGTKNIYMEAISPGGTAPWQQKGTWTAN